MKLWIARPRSRARLAALLVVAGSLLAGLEVRAQPTDLACGEIGKSDNGPYDYRVIRDDRLIVVEKFHFPPETEALVRGKSGTIGDDLSFVLRAFPNHFRALVAMTRLSKKVKSQQPVGAQYTTECYLLRAIRFTSDDVLVRLLYATWLQEQGRGAEVAKQLDVALTLAKDEPLTHYNIGLVAFEAKDYDRALTQAWRAQRLGLQRTELKDMLTAAGRWRETEASAAAGSASAASAPAN